MAWWCTAWPFSSFLLFSFGVYVVVYSVVSAAADVALETNITEARQPLQ